MREPCENTDCIASVLEDEDGNGLFLFRDGGIGISIAGLTIVKTLKAWHDLAFAEEIGPDPRHPKRLAPKSASEEITPITTPLQEGER